MLLSDFKMQKKKMELRVHQADGIHCFANAGADIRNLCDPFIANDV